MICKYCGGQISKGICSSCGKAVSLSYTSHELQEILSGTPAQSCDSGDESRLQAAFDSGYEKGCAEGYRKGRKEAEKETAERGQKVRRQLCTAGVCAAVVLILLSSLIAGKLSGASGYKRGLSEGEAAGYDNGYAEGEAAGSRSGYDTGYAEGEAAGSRSGYDTGYAEGKAAAAEEEQPDVFRIGSNGDEVLKIQEALISLGYLEDGQADGDFGEQTAKAVKKFQKASGLEETGEVDAAAKTKLEDALAKLEAGSGQQSTDAVSSSAAESVAGSIAESAAESAAESGSESSSEDTEKKSE